MDVCISYCKSTQVELGRDKEADDQGGHIDMRSRDVYRPP